MKTPRFAPVFLFIAVALSAAGLARAQDEPAEGDSADELFFETVNVNLVNVEVFVTDKKGEPIIGLTKDDFEILEDKRPVKITNFYVTREGKPLIPTTVPVPEPVEEEVPGVKKPDLPLIPEAQKLYLGVYVDNFNIRPFERNRVFRDLRAFLNEELGPEDQVMLVSYDRTLKIRHPFTNDPGVIARALFELENLSGHAVHRDSDRRDLLREIDEAEDQGDVEWRVIQYAENAYNDISFTLSALKEYVGSLGGLEGRKALLYVSGGLEMIQGEDLFHAVSQKFQAQGGTSAFSRMQDFNAQRDFTRLTQLANTNRVSFYTIDAAGLRVATSAAADMDAIATPQLSGFVDSIYISNQQAAIQYMAEQTGGRALINTNRWDTGLTKIARDFDTYYSLGYQPAHFGDGRYHKIKVRLKEKRKGVQIRHRQGYRDHPLTTRMADKTTSVLMYGFENNPMSLALRVGQSRRGDDGNFVVPIALMVPIGELSLVPRERIHQGRIKIFFSAMDDEGRTSDMQQVPLDIRIPAEEIDIAREKAYVYTVSLQMRGGNNRLAVGVRDEIGATESFVSRTVSVGS
ncbi:MAG: VWA domain-containing protein [Thermoanaerobaculia bacterium]